MPIITLTSDFGAGSPYVAAIKGVIYSIDPSATVVDISHVVPHLDITHGGKCLRKPRLGFRPIAFTSPWSIRERARRSRFSMPALARSNTLPRIMDCWGG